MTAAILAHVLRPITVGKFVPMYCVFFKILTLKTFVVPAVTFKGHSRSSTMLPATLSMLELFEFIARVI